MTEHKDHKNKSHKEHSEHKHNFFTKPVILAAVIGVVVIIAVVIAIVIFAGKSSLPPCADVQGICRTSCMSGETESNNAKCDSSYPSCCIKTNENTNVNTDVETSDQNNPNVITTDSCYDSDGNNPDVSGFVQLSSGLKHSDSCADSLSVSEVTCAADGKAVFTKIPCLYGCRLGACASKDKTCYDSDGGEDIYTKGQVIDIISAQKWDYCKNAQMVVEMVCDTDAYHKDKLLAKELICTKGCINGACNK